MWKITAVLSVCLTFASCSQSEFDDWQGEPLPVGKYPLTFTASVDRMKTRADGKDNWIDGDSIGVRIGESDAVGKYKLNANGAIKQAVEPLHWQNSATANVTAWFPFEPQTDISIADQSGLSDFSSIDYLAATAEDQSYKNSVGLIFKHQMAKIRCVLKSANTNIISTNEMKNAAITFKGYTIASFAEGVLTGSDFKEIIPVKSDLTHEALLVPTNMAGKELFRIDLKVGGYDKSYSYIPDGDDIDLQPGTSYVFTVTLSRDNMVVSKISASWDGKEENIFPQPIPLKLYLSDDLPEGFFEGNADFSENFRGWDDEEECYKVEDSNTFTISLMLDDDGENFMKGFNVTEGVASINRVRFKDRHVFTIKANTEVLRLEYGDYMQVGDYLYTNGKWRPDIV
ncbi:MAG: fimbrillin family protein, partial [Muribaculaceae bacterium]|nr:fimbrillin family protein [Muribaculaceae bacterium]